MQRSPMRSNRRRHRQRHGREAWAIRQSTLRKIAQIVGSSFVRTQILGVPLDRQSAAPPLVLAVICLPRRAMRLDRRCRERQTTPPEDLSPVVPPYQGAP